ncbi:ATP-binding protein [Peptoniphilus stercorisuis]|uniref:Uncharacterized protein YhaN n=1 Tax=Peptoniphilus stercorisuis TaxID=1436965 RepID=A0ABS4KB47_9FIRM|nr:AAA family ATPase [Peptoniphilus stercorisuis]MBP2025014.1 uncharacterized protein YhaN [Peptoniphilus stercorisuis]
MKIKEIGLVHFGKFHNKSLELKPNINLVFGTNESGKSTTFSFLSGILYGFARDSKKRRLYDNDKEKYKPWIGEDYRGYLELSNRDDYRIERDFNSDDLKFINLTNGKDLSNIRELNKYSRVKQPGAYLFNINKDIFLNTFFVAQLETRVDESTYDSFRSKVSNITKNKSENINTQKAITILENSLKELGKKTWTKSQIGIEQNKIDEINEKIYSLEGVFLDYSNALEELSKINKDIDILNINKENFKLNEEQKIYNEVIKKKKENERLEDGLNNINKDDYENIIKTEEEINNLEEEIKVLNNKLININNLNYYENIYILEEDYEKIHEINEELRILDSINYSKEMEFLLVDIKESKNKSNKVISIMATAILSCVVIVFLSFYFKFYLLNFLLIIPLVYFLLKINTYKVSRELIERLENRMNSLKQKSFEKTSEKKKMDLVLEDLFLKYNVEDKLELEKYLREETKVQTLNNYKVDLNKKESSEIKDRINEITVIRDDLRFKLSELLEEYNVSDVEELKEYFVENISNSKKEKIKSNNNYIKMLLKKRDLESLNHNIEVLDLDSSKNKETLHEKELEKAKIEEKINILEKDIKLLEELKELLIYKNKNLDKLIIKKENTNKALNSILKLQSKNRDNILPTLVSNMNEIISKITNDKYNSLIIDDEFNIKVKDNNINSYVELSSLSSGTIDQVYLAFRMSVLNTFIKDAPIVLDDHFLQYDDLRLKSTLKYLNDLSKEKQIIIFSATFREKNILDDLNINYNFIDMRCI